MTRSTIVITGIMAAVLGMTTLVVAAETGEVAVPQPIIEHTYAQLNAAICVVNYSAEITNPNSGEVTKRDNTVVATMVSPDGLLIAPGHMLFENNQPFNIKVTVRQNGDEQKYDAVMLKKPDDVNLCLLRLKDIGQTRFTYVTFSTGRRLKMAEEVFLLGAMAEPLDYNRCVSVERVGSIIEKPRTTYCLGNAVRFGFVGGPVLDASGKAVGVTGYELSSQEGGDLYTHSGHPLIFHAELFKKYIDTPPTETEERTGKDDGWLGVFSQPLTDDLAEYWGLPKDGGVVVSTIMPGSPAETAGLQMGDVIVKFDDTPVKAHGDREIAGFTKLVRDAGVGKEVRIQFLREKKPMQVTAKIAQRPKSARDAGEYTDKVFGLTVREITTDVRIILNLGEDVKGVIVRRVESGSVAAAARIRPGIIIHSIAEHPVNNLDDFKKAVSQVVEAKPTEVPVFCRFGAVTGFFRLEPRWER